MNKLFEQTNLWGGAVTAIFISAFGQMWFLFVGLLCMNIMDWLTGWYAARANNQESSKIGAKGIVKKVWYWIIILISFYIAFSFEQMGSLIGVNLDFMNMLGYFVLASYLVNEIRSILENAIKVGVILPDFLIKGLKIASTMIENQGGIGLPDEKR